MKKILLIGLITFPFILNGQNLPNSSMKFLEESILNTGHEKVDLSEFNKINFSKIWMEHQDAVIGYIGDSYQRIFIHLISVIKDKITDNEYLVLGKSKVRNNVCDFQGRFIITHVREFNRAEREALYKNALKHGDEEAISRFGKARGFVLAEYYLYENPEQKGSGVFKGVVKSHFYIEKGVLYFDDIDLEIEDKYSNNQFCGIWQSYKTGAQRPCNWGAYRIPEAGDLDIGVGEFSPNTKYLEKGWSTYCRVHNRLESATREEESIWW